jgi:hypothetical protein
MTRDREGKRREGVETAARFRGDGGEAVAHNT